MGDLEEFYCRVDSRWNTRVQVETITSALGNIAESGAGVFGSGRELFERQPLAKEYMGIDDNGEFLSPVVTSALGITVQGEEIITPSLKFLNLFN